MLRSKIIIILCLLVSTPVRLCAQSPAFQHLSTAEGLSDNNVWTAARDRNGVIWIGTSDGLNCFDGNRITLYLKQQYPELADNSIEKILVDDHNRVWIRTNTPFLTMIDEDRVLHKIPVGDTAPGKPVTHIWNTASHGIIAVKGREHYLQVPGNPGRFEKKSLPVDSVLAGNGSFSYSLHDDCVAYYRGGRLLVVDYDKMKTLLNLPLRGLNACQSINRQELIASTASGDVFYRISITGGEVIREYRDLRDQQGLAVSGTLRNMTRIDSNRFVFTTYFSGLYVLDLSGSRLLHWAHDPVDPRSIGGNNTFNIRYDTSGYLFVTTQTSGLHFFNTRLQKADAKTYFMDDDRQVFDGYIQSVTTDALNRVWMGGQDRIICWDRSTDRSRFVDCRLPDGTNISGSETIRVVRTDKEGRLWVGTSRYGILLLDKNGRTLRQFSDSLDGRKTELPSLFINSICPDKKGNWWIGTFRGVCLLKGDDLELISLKGHPFLDTLSRQACNAIWVDDAGRVWVGTTQGAWRWDESRRELKQYSTANGLSHNFIYCFEQDNLGNFYIGTRGGLSVIRPDESIRSIGRTNGLRNDRCEQIQRDEKGFLWIANLNCLLRYDPVSDQFAVFEEGPGFIHGGFRIRSSYKSADGEMIWGTDRGLLYFHPSSLNISTLPLRPTIHALHADGRSFRFTREKEIDFGYAVPSFVIEFSSGDLSGDRNYRFLYRLDGYDRSWQQPATTGQVVYSQLPPGRYTFELKASRDGINWHEAYYPVVIHIRAPWWKQPWFRALFALAAVLTLYGIYRIWRQRKRSKNIEAAVAYFAGSSYENAGVEEILWDICSNCVSALGLEDCVIYLPDQERKLLVQKAAFGKKSVSGRQVADPLEIPFGTGIVGAAAQSGKTLLVSDTSRDPRYVQDDERRYSELSVPVVHEGKLLALIDTEHRRKRFFKKDQVAALETIASLCAAKIARSLALEAMQRSRMELMELNMKMAESRFLNLRLQMNPHFLFNSLSSIQHLIVSQQTNKAYKYLTIFSQFLRLLLDFAEKNFITLDEEVRILQLYIELESLRFDDSFQWEVTVDETLVNDEVLVPSLMVQPFAENAIWHGLLHQEGEKRLQIRFSSDREEGLTCTIRDNGIGRDRAREIRQKNISARVHESKGISIIRERLKLLEEKTGKPASVQIEDAVPCGTLVTISIPFYNPEEA